MGGGSSTPKTVTMETDNVTGVVKVCVICRRGVRFTLSVAWPLPWGFPLFHQLNAKGGGGVGLGPWRHASGQMVHITTDLNFTRSCNVKPDVIFGTEAKLDPSTNVHGSWAWLQYISSRYVFLNSRPLLRL